MNSSRKFAALALLLALLAGCDQSDSAQDESAPSAGKQTDSQQPAETSPPAKPESAQSPVTAPPANPGGNEPPVIAPPANPGSEVPPEVAPPINPEAVKAAGFITLVPPSGRGAFVERENLVIRNPAEWQALWTKYVAALGWAEPLPEVDFTQFMVLGIVRSGPNGCYGAGIEKVEQSASAVTVNLWFHDDTGPGGACPAVPSDDVHLVLVPQSSLPVQFVERTRPVFQIDWGNGRPALQVVPYLQSFKPGTGNPACAQLVVPFALRNADYQQIGEQLFPSQLKVNAVGVVQEGKIRWLQPLAGPTDVTRHWITDSDWLHDTSAGATGSKFERVLRGEARACAPAGLRLDQPVDVIFSLSDDLKRQEGAVYSLSLTTVN